MSLIRNLIAKTIRVVIPREQRGLQFIFETPKETKGRIVGISSLTGKTGAPTRSGYAASKHAMAGFFDTLRIELADAGVSVKMIYPGFVATEVRQRAFAKDGEPLGKSPVRKDEVMTVETCARLIIQVAAQRKRELVMTLRGKLGM